MNNKLLEQLNTVSLRDYQPVPFWSWNDRLKSDHLQQQIRDMNDVGMGGFFMHARGGLETEYMSEEWFEAVQASVDEAKRLGMNAWCYDENGWPSGFAGGELLKDSANWAHYLTFEVKDCFDPAALAVFTLHDRKLQRVTAPVAGETSYQCVYDCTNSSVTDILNPRVVDAFIEATHERYYERFADEFGKTITGFFTDEPQYFRGNTGYSPMILEVYPQRYGADPLDMIGSLFVDCEGAEGFRFRYWRLMNELFTENFAGRIYKWCNDHNCQLTGHTVEERSMAWQLTCCAGVMPFYEYEHIPGIDCLARDEVTTEIAPRQLSSVAQQLGKKQTLTETFGCCGWDVTPLELKRLADIQYVNGVNMMCHHLYPYSIRGQRKRDYPAFYTGQNPWIRELDKFNAHYTNLGYLLAETREEAPVLMIHPMHSAYLTFDRRRADKSVAELDKSFEDLAERFGAACIGHHYADERLLEKYGSVSGSTITLGQCSYECVVIPDMRNLDSSTVSLLKDYVAGGGKLYLAGNAPDLMDGESADLSFLQSNVTFEELTVAYGHFSRIDSPVRATLRCSDNDSFFYATNLSLTESQAITFLLPFAGAFVFDPMTKACTPLCFRKTETGIAVDLNMAPGESMVIFRDDTAESAQAPIPVSTVMPLSKEMKLAVPAVNAMTLDNAQLSYDGEVYTEMQPVMAISDRLLRERTNRTVWLRYCFNAEYIPAEMHLEVETLSNAELFVNGTRVHFTETGVLDHTFVRGDIAPLVHPGSNEIVMKLCYHQSQHVYDVFNGFYYGNGEITETLVNCLSYETNIEAVYLFGQFSVLSDKEYVRDIHQTRITTGNFTIAPPVTAVNAEDITLQGFPFFRDTMVLETEVELTDTDWRLRCNGRLQCVKVWVNGSCAGLMLFNDILDLHEYLQVGTNILRLELTASNRNLLGPFHISYNPEPFGVGPDTFSKYGSWQDGKSRRHNPRYAFVRFGIDTLQLEK